MAPVRKKRFVPRVTSSYDQGASVCTSLDANAAHDRLARFATVVGPSDALEDACNICVESFTEPSAYDEGGDTRTVVKLSCGHCLHYNCAFKLIGDEEFIRCPNCNVVMGIRKGDQPDGGAMRIRIEQYSLPGFSCPTILISYEFPRGGGIQGRNHPNPGLRFSVRNFPRAAYLPYNDEGREIADMLKIAFQRRLIFTVGNSVTDNVPDTVTWASIHHKTRSYEAASFGYPDPNYFNNVRGELAAVGVAPSDIGSDRVPWDVVSLIGAVYK